jgi:menaquinone reductase, molybdopterin-binding-like subunit
MAESGRRTFLGGAGGLLAAAAAGCRPRPDPYAVAKPPVPVAPNLRPGSETQVLSTCGLCPAGCGIRVRVVEGRAVKVEGNPHSPVNRGRLCARGQAALALLYHPDRVPGPRRRLGGRGENRWQPLSWDDAIAEVAAELSRLRVAGTPQALVLIDGQERGTTHALWARFLRAFGSPNHIGHGATGRGAALRAMVGLFGTDCLPGYDFENARVALLVGTGALESSAQAMHLARAVARGARPRLLCAWPRLPPSGVLVDEWLPLAPGGAAALLLALAHVLLRDGLADEAGLPAASDRDAWRARIATDHSPRQAEARTGIAAGRIEQLARELAASRPSLVAVDEDTADDASVAAGFLLNALLGSFRVAGGVLVEWAGQGAHWPFVVVDAMAARGLAAAPVDGRAGPHVEASRILALPAAISAAKPYPVKALLLHYSNPAYSKPNARAFAQAIGQVPLVISFSPLDDESARYADWVLPDHSFLERWDLSVPGHGARVLSQVAPVVRPRHDTLATGEVVLRLAATLGGSVARAFPWPSYRAAAESFVGRAAEAAAALGERGVWAVGESRLAEGERPRRWQEHLARVGDVPPAAPAEDATGFPFVLVPFRGLGYAEGGMRHLAWLCELPSPERDPWQPRIEIAARDARELGVADGDAVVVESRHARVAMRAQVHDGIRPGSLGLPLGDGAWPDASVAARPADLLGSGTDEHTGQWQPWATRARLWRVG